MKVIVSLFILLQSFGNSRVNLFSEKEEATVVAPQKVEPKRETSPRAQISSAGASAIIRGGDLRVFPEGLFMGSELLVELSHGVIAFLDEESFVRGRVLNRRYKNAIVLGRARLEKNSKRIFIEFQSFIWKGEEYSIRGQGYEVGGVLGIGGEHESREAKYMAAEVLSAISAGMLEASVEKNQNVFGNYQEVPSEERLLKKALASGGRAMSERYQEKLKQSEEFSVAPREKLIKMIFH